MVILTQRENRGPSHYAGDAAAEEDLERGLALRVLRGGDEAFAELIGPEAVGAKGKRGATWLVFCCLGHSAEPSHCLCTLLARGMEGSHVLKCVTNGVPHARHHTTVIEPLQTLRPPRFPRDGPRTYLPPTAAAAALTTRDTSPPRHRIVHLRPAFDQLGGSGDDKGGEAAHGAGPEDAGEAARVGVVALAQQGESAVVRDEEDGVERAVSEDRGCGTCRSPECEGTRA